MNDAATHPDGVPDGDRLVDGVARGVTEGDGVTLRDVVGRGVALQERDTLDDAVDDGVMLILPDSVGVLVGSEEPDGDGDDDEVTAGDSPEDGLPLGVVEPLAVTLADGVLVRVPVPLPVSDALGEGEMEAGGVRVPD